MKQYTEEESFQIVAKHLLEQALAMTDADERGVNMTDRDIVVRLANTWLREADELEREASAQNRSGMTQSALSLSSRACETRAKAYELLEAIE